MNYHSVFNDIHLPSTNRASQMINISESHFWLFSLRNHVALFGPASPGLLHSLIGHIKTPQSFKSRCNNGRWVVLYALIPPQWPHSGFCGLVRIIDSPKQGCVGVLLSWAVQCNQLHYATVLEERVRTVITWITQDGIVPRVRNRKLGLDVRKIIVLFFKEPVTGSDGENLRHVAGKGVNNLCIQYYALASKEAGTVSRPGRSYYPVHCAKLTLVQPTWSAYPHHLVFLIW